MDNEWYDNEEDEEVEYIPLGDEFETQEWKYPETDFQKRILSICGRKHFHKEVEKKRVSSIEQRMGDDTTLYPKEYVEALMAWAQRMNITRTKITLPTLIGTIRDRDRVAKYLNKKAKEGKLKSQWTREDYEEGDDPIPN